MTDEADSLRDRVAVDERVHALPVDVRNEQSVANMQTPSTTANLTDAMAEIVRRNTLVGFLGEADDVARVIVFLLSEDSRYITGEVIRVDGGQLSHTPTYDALRAAASGPTR